VEFCIYLFIDSSYKFFVSNFSDVPIKWVQIIHSKYLQVISFYSADNQLILDRHNEEACYKRYSMCHQ